MSPCPAPPLSGNRTRHRWLAALVAAVLSISAGCGSSAPKTQVLGQQEQREAAIDVELLDAVCITNTPTHAPC